MSKIEETIKILLFSNKRKDLLLMLKDGARSIDELRDELEISMPNLIPHLKILENAKLIWRKKKNVHLTERGLLCVEALINFLNSIKNIDLAKFVDIKFTDSLSETKIPKADEKSKRIIFA